MRMNSSSCIDEVRRRRKDSFNHGQHQVTSAVPFHQLDRTASASSASSTRSREETQRLESIYQQKLAALEALKKSLLHQAFTGATVEARA